jgi:adenosylcobyric acid synthase
VGAAREERTTADRRLHPEQFRGDQLLLTLAPERLEELTGVPLLGVVPWIEHGLPDEDGAGEPIRRGGRQVVSVLRYPTASNLDEFRALEQVADVVCVSLAHPRVRNRS